MRKISLLFLLLLVLLCSHAQKNIEGNWEGKLNLGSTSLRLVFHIKKEATGFSATMDSPDQGATGIAVSKTGLRNDSLLLEVTAVGGKAQGKLIGDTLFSGQWSQGMALPLEMKKVKEPTKLNRPQTPQPPFSYISEDVIYHNSDSSIQYGATLTSPATNAGPLPAIILITGSGQQNRDEELFGHKPFAVLADYLTRQGYIVLRVDDRGVGKTTGDVTSSTSKDFANDVMAGIDYLKKKPAVAKNKIGLLGHSEGGMIAQIVASQRPDVAFVISMAGPGQKIDALMEEQGRAVMKSSGVSDEAIKAMNNFIKPLLPVILNAASDTLAKQAAKESFTKWAAQTPKATVELTTGIRSDEDLYDMVALYRSPWMRYFFMYDPAPFIRKMKGKVLVLNGEKDIQVAAKPNLDGWRASLQKSKVKKYYIIEMNGLNHLFQHCKTCSVQEYGQIEETMAPEALEMIGKWLKENIK